MSRTDVLRRKDTIELGGSIQHCWVVIGPQEAATFTAIEHPVDSMGWHVFSSALPNYALPEDEKHSRWQSVEYGLHLAGRGDGLLMPDCPFVEDCHYDAGSTLTAMDMCDWWGRVDFVEEFLYGSLELRCLEEIAQRECRR